MFYQHNMGAGGWIFMALGNIVIWGLIIAFVLWLMQDLRSRPHRHHIASGVSASEIIDRRLATGEISPEEHGRLRTTLASAPTEVVDRDTAERPRPRDPSHRSAPRIT